MLELHSLKKQYRTGDLALRGVTISIPKGQTVCLIGPSGAGKSTLIRCVNRLVEPSSGHIQLNGIDITAMGYAELRRTRRQIGMIFQEHALIERLSVMENLLSGRLGYVSFWPSFFRRFPQADIDRAFHLLDKVGLSDHVDKRADALSGGQRQRVGIARALMQQPSLLLVDEPTASLDPKTSRDILRLITALAKETGVTTIINIHDVPLAKRFADRIIGLQQGSVVFDGEASELDDSQLTAIYGDEDWSGTSENDDNGPAADEPHKQVSDRLEAAL